MDFFKKEYLYIKLRFRSKMNIQPVKACQNTKRISDIQDKSQIRQKEDNNDDDDDVKCAKKVEKKRHVMIWNMTKKLRRKKKTMLELDGDTQLGFESDIDQ